MQLRSIAENAREVVAREGLAEALRIYSHVFRWGFYKRLTKAEFVTRSINGYKMLLSLREPGISEVLNHYGDREPEHVRILEECLNEGMCALDIGGNIGYYMLLMASRVGAEGKVYSVEPVPANFRILEKNVALNGFEDRVEALQMAMSNVNGTTRLDLSNQSNLHSLHADSGEKMAGLLDLSGESIEVATSDLASFLKGKRLPDLLRMDVEGHEVEILTGLARCAVPMKWYPDVLFEVHAEYYDDGRHDISAPLSALFELGYQPLFVASNQEPADEFKKRQLEPDELVGVKDITRGIYREVDIAALLEIIQVPRQARCILLRKVETAIKDGTKMP